MGDQKRIALTHLTVHGFKSFNNDGHLLQFDDITVLIGANGAGKSNVISFFKMLAAIMNKTLAQHVGEQGSASSILHYGPKRTPDIKAKLEFENENYYAAYEFALGHAPPDSLIFTQEVVSFQDKQLYPERERIILPTGGKESGLGPDLPDFRDTKPQQVIYRLLANCRVYQFHDTSASSRIRNSGYINQTEYLYSDGGNLAAFLYGLKENGNYLPFYDKIIRHIRQVFPQFGNFDLKPTVHNDKYILLDWRERGGGEYQFGPHQISDGSLRFMALAALLLQPPSMLPAVIVLDEPELGLHPSAVIELAGMIKMASRHTQVVLATQSPALLDEFSPGQITVVERDPVSRSSKLAHYNAEELKEWLADFTLSEIWDKNVLGGKP
jgi:predicted ATPase